MMAAASVIGSVVTSSEIEGCGEIGVVSPDYGSALAGHRGTGLAATTQWSAGTDG